MKIDIKRAWTDPDYRATLGPDQISALPPNPAGEAELTDADLDAVTGGWIRPPISWGCPQPRSGSLDGEFAAALTGVAR